jgi:hypothetical protein
MKKLLLAISIFIMTSRAHSQNLVPNGDFEIYGTVPCGWSANPGEFASSTASWNSPTNATPDIHSTLVPQNCTNHHPNSTASCTNGSQMPHSGNIFAGFYTHFSILWREYLQVQLTQPMIPGTTYYVRLYVSIGEESQEATNNIGVGFSTTVTNSGNSGALGFAPQILFPDTITDTLIWVLLKDTITPTQPYEYIIIGNFFDDASTNVVSMNPGGCVPGAYYYCDDVCISSDSTICYTTVGMNEVKNPEDFVLSPNPFSDNLNITAGNNELSEIILYDIASRKLLQQKFTNSVSLNTSRFARGIYLYELRNKKGVMKKGKVIHR